MVNHSLKNTLDIKLNLIVIEAHYNDLNLQRILYFPDLKKAANSWNFCLFLFLMIYGNSERIQVRMKKLFVLWWCLISLILHRPIEEYCLCIVCFSAAFIWRCNTKRLKCVSMYVCSYHKSGAHKSVLFHAMPITMTYNAFVIHVLLILPTHWLRSFPLFIAYRI